LLVGAPGAKPAGPQSGRVSVYSGKDASVLYTFAGSGPGDQLGFSVSGASDVNGDGRYDFLFGAPGAPNGAGHGRVRVVSGLDGSVLYALEGRPTASLFGFAVAGTGELNRDHHADFAIGVPGADTLGQDAGDTVLFSGLQCLATWTNYGSGWPGTNGIPSFTVSDNPVLCRTLDLLIENSRGIKLLAAMFIGLTEAQLPTAWDGFLLLIPFSIVPLTLPAGLVQIPIEMPCDTALCGLTVYHQVLELDDGASKGVSFTPGLKLVLGGVSWP
ncbi:MAG: integrin alpha, partial [Planctomycetota bacterium]